MIFNKVSCEFCKDEERYNPDLSTPSNKFSECPRTKEKCAKEINNKIDCEETYDKNDPNSKYKMDRRCRCDYENDYIPSYYDDENDNYVCLPASELTCDPAPCSNTDDGRMQKRDESMYCSVLW